MKQQRVIAQILGTLDDKIELKFRLEEGQEYKMLMTMEQEIVQWFQGNEMEMLQTMGVGQTLTVTDVDDEGTMTIEASLGPMYMKMEGPQGTFEYDSEDPPDEVPMAAKGLAAGEIDAFFVLVMRFLFLT